MWLQIQLTFHLKEKCLHITHGLLRCFEEAFFITERICFVRTGGHTLGAYWLTWEGCCRSPQVVRWPSLKTQTLPEKMVTEAIFTVSLFCLLHHFSLHSTQQWLHYSFVLLLLLTQLSKSSLLPFTFLVIFNSSWALALTSSLNVEAMSLYSSRVPVSTCVVHLLLLYVSSVRSFHLQQPNLLPHLFDFLQIGMEFFHAWGVFPWAWTSSSGNFGTLGLPLTGSCLCVLWTSKSLLPWTPRYLF